MIETKRIEIGINGKTVYVTKPELNYFDVLMLANKNSDILYTVTYFRAKSPKSEGSLTRADKIEVQDGTIIDCYFTGNA